MKFFDNLKNKIDFYIRKKMKFSRKGYFEEAEDLSNIFGDELKQRENDLHKKYGFGKNTKEQFDEFCKSYENNYGNTEVTS